MGQSRSILVTIIPRHQDDEAVYRELEELQALVHSYGGAVAAVVTQHREVHDKGAYIGTGKLREVVERVREQEADTVIFNGVLKPGHLYAFAEELRTVDTGIRVWDRVDLILHIFAQHARTAEARLQIELAAMRHMGPRIYGMGLDMSRQGGGIGGRGIGETNTERMKRHWREETKKTEERLAKLTAERERQLARRARQGFQTVSLVGYTNAGKTTLFNALSGKGKFADDLLFATLDSAVGTVRLPEVGPVLFSDTIGFIAHLPPELIGAFRSTLLESIHADVLLHVIDASDARVEEKVEVVEQILAQLGLAGRPKVYVLTKSDQTESGRVSALVERYAAWTPVGVSTVTGQGLTALREVIARRMAPANPTNTNPGYP